MLNRRGSALGGNADAGIPNRDHDLAPVNMCDQLNASAGVGVFGAVIQDVPEHLCKSGEIGVEVDRLGGKRDRQTLPFRVDEWAALSPRHSR